MVTGGDGIGLLVCNDGSNIDMMVNGITKCHYEVKANLYKRIGILLDERRQSCKQTGTILHTQTKHTRLDFQTQNERAMGK